MTLYRGLDMNGGQASPEPITVTCADAGLQLHLQLHDGREAVSFEGGTAQLYFQTPGEAARQAAGTLEMDPEKGQLTYTVQAEDFPNPAVLDTGEVVITWPDGRRWTPAKLLFTVLPSLAAEALT